ncbi:MAG: crotonobetainyl-CoA:carnitine CoA-transferase CaiB-like acyl-CoA transferase [Gammaproteobacteria bacterium]|jgi:crotonobetainyl-CoA:carnitine CoA-transferase CaiB-like acyl-CoA transferase
MPGALDGFRVLDLSRILAGPWAGQMLADLGAEVIKVERPESGDDTRSWGPPFMPDRDGNPTSESAYFHCANRGKYSVCIDISCEEGQQLIRDLVVKSDVLIENFKVGGLKKYGLDYDGLKALNPKLIYCSITGFGQTGPYAERAGYDFMIQAMGGMMSVTGEPEGQPMKIGVALADILTGLYSTNAIQSALIQQLKTGLGQYIDMALLDVQVATLANQAMNYLASGQSPSRLGNAHPNIVPYQAFQTLDGYIILAVGNDRQFLRFCELAGFPEKAVDSRFNINSARVKNRELLLPDIEAVFKLNTTDWWLEALNQRGIPCGPINTIEQVFDDEQILHRKMVRKLDHRLAGSVDSVSNPINLSLTPVVYTKASPLLGEHTDEILLRVLELNNNQLSEYKQGKVIAQY